MGKLGENFFRFLTAWNLRLSGHPFFSSQDFFILSFLIFISSPNVIILALLFNSFSLIFVKLSIRLLNSSLFWIISAAIPTSYACLLTSATHFVDHFRPFLLKVQPVSECPQSSRSACRDPRPNCRFLSRIFLKIFFFNYSCSGSLLFVFSVRDSGQYNPSGFTTDL